MASQDSQNTCANLPKMEVLTESGLDELSEMLTNSLHTTRDQRIVIKTALLLKSHRVKLEKGFMLQISRSSTPIAIDLLPKKELRSKGEALYPSTKST
jgi:hypothetical protein